jgi:hypothetical protein
MAIVIDLEKYLWKSYLFILVLTFVLLIYFILSLLMNNVFVSTILAPSIVGIAYWLIKTKRVVFA